MKFWASSETFCPSYSAVERARQCVEPYLIEALENSSMANLDFMLRYIPIVMPVDMHDRYKERSRAIVKQGIYDCAPHLKYEIFVDQNFESQISEYVRGISTAVPQLIKFGLNTEQLNELSTILESAVNYLLNARPDQTRH